MKKVLLRTLSCLVVAVALLVLASRWATLFWLLVIAGLLYWLFGGKVVVELRLGVSGDTTERRIYGAFVWKRGGIAQERADQCEVGQLEVSPAGRHG